MKKLLFPITLISLLVLGACKSSDEPTMNEDLPQTLADIVSQPDDTYANSEEIANIINKNRPQSRSTGYTVSALNSSKGEPLAYIVNFNNDGGWMLLSATKEYYPIIAYNDEGSFKFSQEIDGIKQWLSGLEEEIAYVKTLPHDSIMNFKRLWYPYKTRTLNLNQVRSRDYIDEKYLEAFQILQDTMLSWYAKGYDVYTYYDITPDSDPILQQQMQQAYQSVDYVFEDRATDLCAVAVYGDQTVTKQDPRTVKSTWNQNGLYNQSYPLLSNGKHAYVGCGPLAVAQIMRFYEYPKNFDWQSMPLNYGTKTTSDFLLEVTTKCKGKYDLDGTSTSTDNCVDALKKYGYLATKEDYNVEKIYKETSNGHPLLATGVNSNDDGGHAWIICQSIQHHFYTHYISITFSNFADLYRCDYVQHRNSSRDIYINWGWGGYCDGYYQPLQLNPNGNNYNKNRKIVTRISPLIP